MHACIHIHIHARKHTHIHAYIHIYMHACIHRHTQAYTYMHACIHKHNAYIHIYMHAYIYTYIHIYIHVCVRKHTYTCMHTCTQVAHHLASPHTTHLTTWPHLTPLTSPKKRKFCTRQSKKNTLRTGGWSPKLKLHYLILQKLNKIVNVANKSVSLKKV